MILTPCIASIVSYEFEALHGVLGSRENGYKQAGEQLYIIKINL